MFHHICLSSWLRNNTESWVFCILTCLLWCSPDPFCLISGSPPCATKFTHWHNLKNVHTINPHRSCSGNVCLPTHFCIFARVFPSEDIVEYPVGISTSQMMRAAQSRCFVGPGPFRCHEHNSLWRPQQTGTTNSLTFIVFLCIWWRMVKAKEQISSGIDTRTQFKCNELNVTMGSLIESYYHHINCCQHKTCCFYVLDEDT